MKRKNLTKKQVHAANGMQLIRRLSHLHTKASDRHRDAGIPMTDIWEASAIVKELRQRLRRIWPVFFRGEMK